MDLAPPDFVPLDRLFEHATVGEYQDYWADILSGDTKPHDWSWLRRQSRVVALLAQAGSGKTVEFQHQVDEARKAGREAFFFRIERLCTLPLEEAHEDPACRSRFEHWLRGNLPAEFYLDSVDEAKLPQTRTARPLKDAISKLRSAIEQHLDRVAVFVSCRSSEWLSDVEQRALDEFALAVTEKSPADKPVAVFNAKFVNLDRGRIERLAAARGAEGAMEILTESEAIADILTPLDAILYLDTYLEFRGTDRLLEKFSSRGALLDSSVRRRLSEEGSDKRRSQLDLTSALRAAQFLAFASIVAQTPDIAVSGSRKDGIDPGELLAHGHAALAPDSLRQLLACSLFMPAGQGSVRFYRQEARAMLAAQWLRDRMADGASSLRVTDQFIKTVFGNGRVPIVYGSMLAWLSSYDPVVRRRMIQDGPEWVIEDGDPRSLALEDRIAALQRHFQLGPNRFTGDFRFDVDELRRFAKPEMEPAVVAELTKLPPGDLLDQVIHMCEAGRYAGAVPHLVGILMDFTRDAGDRMFAVRALMACGTLEDMRQVALHYVATGGPNIAQMAGPFAASRNDNVLLDLVTFAYPKAIGVTDALALLRQVCGKDHAFVATSFARWTPLIPAEDLEAWWVGLDQICFTDDPTGAYKPFGYDHPKMHPSATILLRAMGEICARYIREVPSLQFDRDLLIYDHIRHIRDLGAEYSRSRRGSPLPAALADRVAFRMALFEKLATLERRRNNIFAYTEHLQGSGRFEETIVEDMAWLLRRYRESDGDQRAGYAEAYLGLVWMVRKRGSKRLSLARAALIRQQPDWPTVKEAIIAPALAPWYRFRSGRRFRAGAEHRGIKSAGRRLIAEVWRRAAMMQQARSLRQGFSVPLLIELVLGRDFEGPTETALTERFGKRFGVILIEGTKAFARRNQPVNRGGSIFQQDILANLGLRYIWNADREMTGVNPSAALRSALFHSTDWPEWATELALAHPLDWVAVSIPLLREDLTWSVSRHPGFPGRDLSSMSHRDEAMRAILSAPLFAVIRALGLIEVVDVEPVCKILNADPAVEAALPGYASRQSREAWHEGTVQRAMAWLPYWLGEDEGGLRLLLDWMEAEPSLVKQGLALYVRRCAQHADLGMPALDIRERFAALAYRAIDPARDEPVREVVHSVTARDDLQQLRSDVGNMLSANFDVSERAALERLLATYVEPVSRDWAQRWRNNYEKGAAKPSPWSPTHIIAFGDDLTASPTSGQELLDRVAELVADLEAELANAEFDRRGLFTTTIVEADFRAWLGHALDGRRRPWFSIVQEAETASEARTDLRLEQRGTGNSVMIIEIKLVHRWSYDALLDKFSSQLVAQYLLDERTRHGIYLLVDLGRLPKGTMPDGSKPDVKVLAASLNAEAAVMRASGGPIAIAQAFTITASKRQAARQRKAAAPKKRAAKAPVAAAGKTKPRQKVK